MKRARPALLLLLCLLAVSLQAQPPRKIEKPSLKLSIESIERTEHGFQARVSVVNEGNRPITLAVQTSPAGLTLQSLDIQQWGESVGWESVGACRDIAPNVSLTISLHSGLWDVQPIFDLSKLDYVTVVCPRKLRTLKGRVRAILYVAYASHADFNSGRPILENVTSAPVDLKSFEERETRKEPAER